MIYKQGNQKYACFLGLGNPLDTAVVMKTVPSMYTLFINNIYLSQSIQVSGGNGFQETHGITRVSFFIKIHSNDMIY